MADLFLHVGNQFLGFLQPVVGKLTLTAHEFVALLQGVCIVVEAEV